jgi:hypothetical protein
MIFTHDGVKETIKGIQDWELLLGTFDTHIHSVESINVETDMRAFCNPTRMGTIRKAVLKLIEKMRNEKNKELPHERPDSPGRRYTEENGRKQYWGIRSRGCQLVDCQ